MEKLEINSGFDNSCSDKLMPMEVALLVLQQFNKLTDSLRRHNECLKDFSHSLNESIFSYIMAERLSAFRMETLYALKHYNASFFTKWYYRKKYRKFRYKRICFERILRNSQ